MFALLYLHYKWDMSIKIKHIIQDHKNFNRHTDKGMEELKLSIEKVGVIESITVSSDDKIITGNARQKKIVEVLGEDIEPIVIETDGTRPVVLKRTDIQSNTKKYHEAALLANTTAIHNINLDRGLIEEIAVEEYKIDIEELKLESVESKVVNNSVHQEPKNNSAQIIKHSDEHDQSIPEESKEDTPDDVDNTTDFYTSMLNDCLYESDNEYEIPNLLSDKQAGKLLLPFAGWGTDSRLKTGIATYHFYVDDYRFEVIWKNPAKVLSSGVRAIVEPNLSLYDTTPVAYGLHQIYKKRWISRYFQECGIMVYADLNVSAKFKDYNKIGIPKGYNAFFTRGYADRLEYLKIEFETAKEISGLQTPNFLVYGGGEQIRKFCIENSLVYVEQFMQNKKNG